MGFDTIEINLVLTILIGSNTGLVIMVVGGGLDKVFLVCEQDCYVCKVFYFINVQYYNIQ